MERRHRLIWYSFIAVAACILVGGSVFAQAGPHGGHHGHGENTSGSRCPVCGMYTAMFIDWNSQITFKDGTVATFDGAKDMFKYYLDMGKYAPNKSLQDVVSVSVKDYYSRESISAVQAYFVIWSDTYGPMGHEPIPFKEEGDAKRFLKEHKGKTITRFQDVNLQLLTSLDNPE